MLQAESSPGSAPSFPRSEQELLTSSATQLGQWIRARSISSAELVETTIRRIEQVNPSLNAVVQTRFEEARAEAREVDERIAKASSDEQLPPLLGVPCTIKEFFAVKGLPQTGGLVARRNTRSKQDAPVVARLRAAGAIVVGCTNVPEGGIWIETYNALYGRTNNPWDTRCTSGGSSGGEGAIVAAGGSPFGLGSDIGGSIRVPAAFNGCVGHKPSGRLVPNSGQFPAPSGAALAMLCAGPLVRRVCDVMPLLRILAGPDAGDPVCRAMPLGDPDSVQLDRMTVYVAPQNARFKASAVMERAVEDAARALERRGAKVIPFDVTKLKRGLEYWAGALSSGSNEDYAELLASGTDNPRIRPVLELIKAAFGRSNHTLPALAVALVGGAAGRLDGSAKRFVAAADAFRAELTELLGDNAVLLHPPFTRPAPRHHDVWRTPFDPAYTAIFNVMETPVTVVPVCFDRDGMPVGVQIIAAPGRDHVSVRAALAVEEHFGGWTMATPRGARASA